MTAAEQVICEGQVYHYCREWPFVLPKDDGIRPAGPQDQCLYCRQKIGQRHGSECVCVHCINLYDVLEDGVKVGTWQHADPYYWTFENCEFNKNMGSWCCDNALDFIEWSDAEAKERAKKRCVASCNCSVLEFRWRTTVHDGPLVILR